MKIINWIAYVLLVIGGLNLGLDALGYNVVEAVLGTGNVTKVVYILVGVSALLALCCIRPVEKKAPTVQPVV